MSDHAPPSQKTMNPEVLEDALRHANIPTLLMVLVQMTGDMRWLEPRYHPTRNKGLDDNDSGGLAPEVQKEVRSAAAAAILDWQRGKPLAIAEPDEKTIVRMLSVAMAEHIPDEYGAMIAAELPATDPPVRADPAPLPGDFKYVIVGAGVSGLCAAIQLEGRGADYVILEQHSSVGGTWVENRYPGAGVDTPNHLYSFSFAPHDWPEYFSRQSEIQKYLEWVAGKFGVLRKVQFNTKVIRAEYDESERKWRVTLVRADGSTRTLVANVLISAVGAFSLPKYPGIAGLSSFAGRVVHAARWPDDLDLEGKKVAVIGNGASAMQIVPAIADKVGSLAIFQRSPQWVVPFDKCHKPVPKPVRELINAVPLYRNWYRQRLGWTFNDRLFDSLRKDPTWTNPDLSLNAQNDAYRRMFTRYLEDQLSGRPDLIAKSLPHYPPYGKRILLDNGWYQTLRRENVTLCTDPIREIRSDRIVTGNGDEYPADVLVFATGFEVVKYLSSFEVIGRGAVNIRDFWDDDDCQAYMGTVIPNFPNLFMLYGPNTQPGHGGSFIFICEAQVHYVMSVLSQMAEGDLSAVECKQSVCDRFNAQIMAKHEEMIWTHKGMSTYYRNSRGRVVVTIPYRNVDFWHMTRRANIDDFIQMPTSKHATQSRTAL